MRGRGGNLHMTTPLAFLPAFVVGIDRLRPDRPTGPRQMLACAMP